MIAERYGLFEHFFLIRFKPNVFGKSGIARDPEKERSNGD
jgi:hypothetical protein